ALDPLEQHLQTALEEDDQVGLRHPGTERVVDPVVERQLRRLQRQRREDAVLGEDVVADRRRGEEVGLEQLLLLLPPAEEEEELGGEGPGAPALVEAREEGIVPGLLEARPPAQPLGEKPREAGLPHSDWPLAGDVALVQAGGVNHAGRTASTPARAAQTPRC